MKLSNIFQTLTDNTKRFEEKLTQWESNADAWINDAQQNARTWLDDANARMKQAEREFDEYVASASDTVKAEWMKVQGSLDQQVSDIQAKSEEMQKAIESYEASKRAEAAEAYAAAMSKFALNAQNEAEKAMAFAAKQGGQTEA